MYITRIATTDKRKSVLRAKHTLGSYLRGKKQKRNTRAHTHTHAHTHIQKSATYPTMLKHFAFLLILLGRAMTKNVKQKDAPEVCTLNDQQYPVGATWHPVLAPFGAMPCANCTCLPNAIVHCVHLTQDCPEPKCDAPKILPNRCCPECEDFDNIPPTVLTKENSTKTKKLGCTFYGRSYEHGAIFTSNKTALKPTRSNQCVTCICSNGRILCHLKTCETIKCKKTLKLNDECCPICPGKATSCLPLARTSLLNAWHVGLLALVLLCHSYVGVADDLVLDQICGIIPTWPET